MEHAPASLGPYRLLRVLGEGGMARVFEAEHAETGGCYALKELQLDLADADGLARFQREAELAVSLVHPNVARTHTAQLAPPRPFLVLELLGESLADRLPRGPLSSEEARRVLEQVAAGVAYAHAQGVVHRDLKPANVLFGEDGGAKVTDFGIAAARSVERLTRTGELLGTPAFIAPEQVEDPRAVDARADVYALGAILYACLVGRPPFGHEGSVVSTLLAVKSTPPTRPSQLQPGVDPGLEAVCLRALRKDPAERFASAEAFGEALRAPAPRRLGWALAGALGVGLLAGGLALRGRGATPDAPPARPRSSPSPAASKPSASPASTPRARALERLRIEPAPTPGGRLLADYRDDGTLSTIDPARVHRSATWQQTYVNRGQVHAPSLLCTLPGDGRIVGHSTRPLLWSGKRQTVGDLSHLGVTALLRRGDVVYAGSVKGSVRAMDVRTGQTVPPHEVKAGALGIRALAAGPRGRLVVVGARLSGARGRGHLTLVDARFRVVRGPVVIDDSPSAAAVSPDGALVAIGAVSGALFVAPLPPFAPQRALARPELSIPGVRLRRAHSDTVQGVCFVGADRLISVGRETQPRGGGQVLVWDLAEGDVVRARPTKVCPDKVVFRREGSEVRILLSGLGGLEEWRYAP